MFDFEMDVIEPMQMHRQAHTHAAVKAQTFMRQRLDTRSHKTVRACERTRRIPHSSARPSCRFCCRWFQGDRAH